MVKTIEMTPEEYKEKSSNITILYGLHKSPFGDCLIGVTAEEKAVCFLWFVDNNFDDSLKILKNEWPNARLVQETPETKIILDKIFSNSDQENLTVLLRGTEFQLKVWKALMKIPMGEITTYSKIAEEIGNPKGIRAAGTAMKSNRIGFLVPCHRVTSKTGENKYRWGSKRREEIMQFEKENKC